MFSFLQFNSTFEARCFFENNLSNVILNVGKVEFAAAELAGFHLFDELLPIRIRECDGVIALVFHKLEFR